MRRLFLQWKMNTKEHRLEFNKKSNLYYMQNQTDFKQRFNVKYDVLKKEYRNILNELDKEKSEKEKYHRLAEYIQLEVDALVKDKTINELHMNKLVYCNNYCCFLSSFSFYSFSSFFFLISLLFNYRKQMN